MSLREVLKNEGLKDEVLRKEALSYEVWRNHFVVLTKNREKNMTELSLLTNRSKNIKNKEKNVFFNLIFSSISDLIKSHKQILWQI